jgi:hypothetical protein
MGQKRLTSTEVYLHHRRDDLVAVVETIALRG